MGKKQPKEVAVIDDPVTFPIRKKKTFQQNIDLFLKMMVARFSKLSAKQYLSYVHKYIARCRAKFRVNNQTQIVKTIEKIKICKACEQWALKKSKIIQCNECEDWYHTSCIEGEDFDDWKCQACVQLSARKSTPRQSMQRRSSAKINCAKCVNRKSANKKLSNDVLIICMKCDQRYHRECFGKKNTVVCYECH